MRFRFHTVPTLFTQMHNKFNFTSVNLSLKFQQNLSLPKEICAFPKLSARLWPDHAVTEIVKSY